MARRLSIKLSPARFGLKTYDVEKIDGSLLWGPATGRQNEQARREGLSGEGNGGQACLHTEAPSNDDVAESTPCRPWV